MKPATHTLSELFGADIRYVVPLYQRPYVWSKRTHWEPLWADIVDVIDRQMDPAAPTPNHFLGAVVLDQEDTTPGEATKRLVIDGQQRLTTLQLLLAAAAEEAEGAECERESRLLRRLTRNNEDLTSGDARFKVWPTNANQAAFRAVMGSGDGLSDNDDPSNTIHEAHAYFRQAIRAWSRDGKPTPDQLLARFESLRVVLTSLFSVVSINLEPGDNAQVIFETLNARGTPLLAMDLVKNALFYRAAQAGIATDPLHEKVWQPELGQPYWRKEKRQGRLKRPRAELFLMHWLAMRLGRIVPATELFSEFRAHILDKTAPEDISGLIVELCSDASVMRSFDDQLAGSVEARFFATLESLDTTTVFPVALWLFCTAEVSDERRRRSLSAIESWLVRRMLAGLTTKNYNNTAAELLAAIKSNPQIADEAIVRALSESNAATALWPRDNELVRILVTRSLYGSIAQRRVVMVLAAIEVARRQRNNKSESVFTLPPKLTIEHLLPQKWEKHWPAEDGVGERSPDEVRASRNAALHRLGNLTLTSGPLNSSLSNAEWELKRAGLHKHSVLLLNADLTGAVDWDVDAINERGFDLAQEICAVWPGPSSFGQGLPESAIALAAILDEAAAATATVSKANGATTVSELLASGYLDEGETLSARRSGVTATAVVLADGRLEMLGSVFDSPSAAALRAAGTQAENGWQFWFVQRDDELVSLSDIRVQMLGAAT